MTKKKQIKPERTNIEFDQEAFNNLPHRVIDNQEVDSEDFDMVLKKIQKDIHEYTSSGKTNPIDYLCGKTHLSRSAVNSYFFTSYGVFQKDLDNKVKPYVAFTIAIIHAVNIGFLLAELKYGNTTDSIKESKQDADNPVITRI